jgi:hypothetical protein
VRLSDICVLGSRLSVYSAAERHVCSGVQTVIIVQLSDRCVIVCTLRVYSAAERPVCFVVQTENS